MFQFYVYGSVHHYNILRNNQQMQLYAVNLIPLLGSLYMFRVFYTPINRSTIFKQYLHPEMIIWSVPVDVDTV